MRAPECIKFGESSALDVDQTFNLTGGIYTLAAVATWGGGNIVVEMLLPDGTSYAPCHTPLDDDGIVQGLQLPPGSYRLNLTTAADVVGSLARVPGE